jgi:hypothetical protein
VTRIPSLPSPTSSVRTSPIGVPSFLALAGDSVLSTGKVRRLPLHAHPQLLGIAQLILGRALTGLATDSQNGNFDKVCSDLNFLQLVIQAWSGSQLMTTAQADAILADLNTVSGSVPCSPTP